MIKDILKGILRRLLSYAIGGVSAWIIGNNIASRADIELLIIVIVAVLFDLLQAAASRLIKRWHIDSALSSSTLAEFKVLNSSTSYTDKVKEVLQGDATPKV